MGDKNLRSGVSFWGLFEARKEDEVVVYDLIKVYLGVYFPFFIFNNAFTALYLDFQVGDMPRK